MDSIIASRVLILINRESQIRISTMSDINEASKLHTQAADDHESTAKHHRNAADCHDKNKVSEAKDCSKSAMENSNTAQKNTTSACGCSAK
jgi:hypothetical protein